MLRATLALYVRPAIGNSIRTIRRNRRGGQAGIRRQVEAFNDEKAFEDEPEGDFDVNFFEVGKSYRQHEEEMKLRKEQEKSYTVRHKYFKSSKTPNMLTWAEKEHIRNLRKEEEWSVERLVESFPATQDVIVKVMTAKWTPSDMKAVERHDNVVKRNWELFKANKLDDVTPELREHLKRFSDRNFDAKQNAYINAKVDQVQFQFPKPVNEEFSSIITSLEKAKDRLERQRIGYDRRTKQIASNQPALVESQQQLQEVSQINIAKKDKSRRMTYDELMKRSTKEVLVPKPAYLSIDLSKSVTSESVREPGAWENSAVVANMEKPVKVVTNTEKPLKVMTKTDKHENRPIDKQVTPESKQNQIKPFDGIQKYESKTMKLSKFADTDSGVFQNMDRIRIPNELRKEGLIYQKHDSFYNHNGHFLYRVPGLEAT